MKKWALLLVVLMLLPATAYSQAKPTIVVNPFTMGPDVTWPYDVKVMQAQAVAEFKVLLGKDFDVAYQVTDASGKKVLDKKDTIRTNFYAQTASTGTLTHPFAQKIAQRIKDAKLK